MRRRLAPQFMVPLLCAALGALAPSRAAHAQQTQAPALQTSGDREGSDSNRTAPRLSTRDSADAILSDTGDEAGFLSVAPLQVAGARGRRYTGRRIDIDLRDADIHNVLRLLAEVGAVNVVAGQDVSGSVTIRMRNVPWDQALDVILAARSLGMQRNGNIIRVAPQSVLDKEREMLIARQRDLVDLEPIETRLIPVSYASGESMIPQVREMISRRGTVSVDARTNVLIVRDTAPSLNQVERLVRSLDTQTPQVLIEARIVEATSNFSREVGIQWGGDASFGQGFGNPTGLAFPSNIGLAGGAADPMAPSSGLSPTSPMVPNPNFAVNLPAAVGAGRGGAIGLTFGSLNGNFNLNLRLSAAEINNQLRIVSAPRILTLDNREAMIQQGTMIPYSQVSAQGVQTAFQEATLMLRVRPHVTADNSVSLDVRITRDEPDFSNAGTRGEPSILKRQAQTSLLVQDGRTAVIGGIFTRTTGRRVNLVPGLGDIPILGALFSQRGSSDTRSELIIFLTPRIVNRAEAIGR
jgi:type IV pilus assembly protein PilQ